MLSGDEEGNEDTEDIFDAESGKRCTAYSENSGQKYCRRYITTATGKKCKKWGVLYKGSKCEEWGHKDETIYVTETEKKILENPEFDKTEKELKAFYETFLVSHNEYKGVNLEQTTQTNAVKLSHERKWNAIEQEWLAKKNKVLETDMLALSQSNKDTVENLKDEHEKNMREISDKWANSVKETEADLKKKLEEEDQHWSEKLKKLESEKQEKIAHTLRIYKEEYQELKLQFQTKYTQAHEQWKIWWNGVLLSEEKEKKEKAIELVEEHH